MSTVKRGIAHVLMLAAVIWQTVATAAFLGRAFPFAALVVTGVLAIAAVISGRIYLASTARCYCHSGRGDHP